MSSNAFLQPVGCVTQSFVLEPLVGLSSAEPIEPKNPLWRGYWHQGELCVLTGDTGAGKTLMALQLGREMAETMPLKVLYIGHEYDKRGFAERFGAIDEDLAGKFFFAMFNRRESGVHKTYADFKKWLVKGLVGLLDSTGAQVLIFDQPDRLNLTNLQWIEFLNVIEELRLERNLSVLLVVSTRNRNTAKPVELFHTYKHQYTTTFADCVVAVCRTHTNHCTRYQKLLKCKNSPMPGFNKVNVFQILTTDDNYLSILSMEDDEDEYKMLPKTAAMRRMDKQFMAESFRKEGVGFERISALLDVPESTVRGWLSKIKVFDRFAPPKPGEHGLLPAHMRNGYKEFKNPFKDELPEEEMEVEMEQNETQETSLPPSGYSLQRETKNEAENELRKQPIELHTVDEPEVTETPFQAGSIRVNIVRTKVG